MMATQPYVWIEEAVREYKRSRDWFNRRLADGRLRRFVSGDDRRVYLSRQEIETILAIRLADEDRDQG